MKNSTKCRWCNNKATRQDYRDVDGIVSKSPSCEHCINMSTEFLLKRKYPFKTEDGHTKIECPICEGDEHVDIIEEDGMCDSCFQEERDIRPDSIELYKLIEIWSISYKGIWYEVHVDATEHRVITQTFAEYGEVTPEIHKHLEEVVGKIDNI